MFSFILGIYKYNGWVKCFQDNAKQVSKLVVPFNTPTSDVEKLSLLYVLTNIWS